MAQKCAQRCAELVAELDQIKRGATGLTRIDGLGHLPSGVALARKFEQKASGGDYPLDQALADHIIVVEEMQSVFEKIAANYSAAEESNTQSVNAIDRGR
ncbi:hypothetical protein [Rhodococcus sp. OK519]|uniref:hypothetical protein n=1 Tax=Rhodococcus sp. OK519 TaxID=2135729 RepID=UPI002158CDB9